MRYFSRLSLSPVVFGVGFLIGGSQDKNSLASPLDFSQSNPDISISQSNPVQMPTEATWPHFLESARQVSLNYISALPDFTCRQHVQRMAKLGGLEGWRKMDGLVVEVSYYGKAEHYKLLLKDNKPLRGESKGEVGGITSQGDFGNALRLLFTPESNASFKLEGEERIRGHAVVRVSFTVPMENSGYKIGFGDQRVIVAYRGHCWIDLATQYVVRLESEARDIPASVPVWQSSHVTDYEWVNIAGVKYWLPMRASVYLKLNNHSQHSRIDCYAAIFGKNSPGGSASPELEVRNAMEYKQYRKFGSDVRLISE
jgi:hypothetical protein